jgi:tripartite-type tricarboxylate transporter receptor subunit TctC
MQNGLNVLSRTLATCLLAVSAMHSAAQQPYPNRPLRVVVPVVPGGAADTVSRILADKLKELGQPVMVDNRPGGNEMIAMEFVSRAPADGHTLFVQSKTHVIFAFVEPDAPLQPMKAFAPVAPLVRTRPVMVVHPSLPAKTLREFIAFAKTRSGQIQFASAGTNTASRFSGEIFNMLAGVKMQNIPYKGAGQSLTDLVGGHVHVAFYTPAAIGPLVKSGRLRALAISGESRLPAMGEVPTFAEAGLPSYKEFGWQGVFVAAATPKPIVDRLSAEIAQFQAAADVKSLYEKQGLETFVMTSEQFTAYVKAESVTLDKVIKTGDIKFGE